MSSWNGKEIVRWPDEWIDGYPGWIWRDCGCCNGICWSGGCEPIECDLCWANGSIAVHLATGTVAVYPGQSLLGYKIPPDERHTHLAA